MFFYYIFVELNMKSDFLVRVKILIQIKMHLIYSKSYYFYLKCFDKLLPWNIFLNNILNFV